MTPKQFKHFQLPEPNYTSERKNVNGVRCYVDGSGAAYPSVTTVLGCRGKKAIYEWRARVGAEEANKISAKASRGGTALHSLCETYLLNEDLTKKLSKVMPEVSVRFKNYRSFLDQLNYICLLESPILSHVRKYGGTVDCLAMYKGRLCVIDFKTSRRMKYREDIKGYFAQATAYALAISEQYNIKVPDIVIAISVEGVEEAVIYEDVAINHIEYLDESIGMYNRGEID